MFYPHTVTDWRRALILLTSLMLALAFIAEGSRPVIEAIGKLYWLGVSFLLGAAFGASANLVVATIGLKESPIMPVDTY